MRHTFKLLAEYNAWMNSKIYAAAKQLSASELAAPRGAFFGSILGTLNHIVVGDRIWLRRFATHPSCNSVLARVCEMRQPTSLDEVLYDDFNEIFEHRTLLDGIITHWASALTDRDLDHVLTYTTTKGVLNRKRFGTLVTHFFNHQTHHRGQLTTLLFQAGKDVGVTDLLALIPSEAAP